MTTPTPTNRSRVAVIGAGYVGLPTAAVLSHLGHQVVCAESDRKRLAALQRGEIPIVEHGLDELVHEGTSRKTLRFVASATEAVTDATFVFLCVPTPQGADGSADLSAVEAVAREVAPHLCAGAVVVNKSTVPVGTALLVERVTDRQDVAVVSNPEFLREGTAVSDSLHPERIVVGADDKRVAASVGALFSGTRAPLIVTDTTTAETIKYASNAFLALKISYVNALAALCEAVGADVRDVVLGLGYDRRIGFESLRPGPGWGGSCLPKDTAALLHIAESAGYDLPLVREAVVVNDAQKTRVVAKIVGDRSPHGLRVGAWGLTFKAGTDDRRDSPAVAIVRRLVDAGAVVTAFDPTVAPGLDSKDLANVTVCADAYEAARGTDVVTVLTEWPEIRSLDFDKVRELMVGDRIVDGRNLLDPTALRRLGFEYTGIGRA